MIILNHSQPWFHGKQPVACSEQQKRGPGSQSAAKQSTIRKRERTGKTVGQFPFASLVQNKHLGISQFWGPLKSPIDYLDKTI